MNFKRIVKKFLPPIVLSLKQRLFPLKRTLTWIGNYKSWSSAEQDAGGFDTDDIFAKVIGAARLVKDGKAVYERDSALFDSVQYNWPFLTSILIAASENKTLTVLDWGGSLGTSYHTVRKIIPINVKINWIIVEQAHFVSAGKKEFTSEELSFEYDIETVFKKYNVDIVVFSGSLQYFPEPYSLLKKVFEHKFKYLLLDRTLVIDDAFDRLTIQRPDRAIYEASFPCWLFAREKFLNFFDTFVTIEYEFDSQFDQCGPSDDERMISYKGFFFKKNDSKY